MAYPRLQPLVQWWLREEPTGRRIIFAARRLGTAPRLAAPPERGTHPVNGCFSIDGCDALVTAPFRGADWEDWSMNAGEPSTILALGVSRAVRRHDCSLGSDLSGLHASPDCFRLQRERRCNGSPAAEETGAGRLLRVAGGGRSSPTPCLFPRHRNAQRGFQTSHNMTGPAMSTQTVRVPL